MTQPLAVVHAEGVTTAEKLTAAQAAARIGVSVRTLDRYEAAGLITPSRTPGHHRRYAPADVDALLAKLTGED